MEKEAYFLFKQKFRGESGIQLKNGKILFFKLESYYDIALFDEKTLQKLFEINLYEIIKEYIKEKQKENPEIKIKGYNEFNENKNSIKELYDGSILIGRNNYLFVLNINEKNYSYKIIKEYDETILDINELVDKRIIIITEEKIIILKRENKEYIIKEEYPIKEEWKMERLSERENDDFNQYFKSELLPNNRLLLFSSSYEVWRYISRCVVGGRNSYYYKSKIIFIDLNNFEEIKSTEIFKEHANVILLKNEIFIQIKEQIIIYDINSLKVLSNNKFYDDCCLFYKFDDNYLISYPKYAVEDYNLFIYEIKDNKLEKYCDIKSKIIEKLRFGLYSSLPNYNVSLFILRNKRIIIFNHSEMNLFELI